MEQALTVGDIGLEGGPPEVRGDGASNPQMTGNARVMAPAENVGADLVSNEKLIRRALGGEYGLVGQ